MVGAGVLRDFEFGAEEGGAYLSDELFSGIGSIPEALSEFAVEAVLGAGPMHNLMRGDRIPCFGAGHVVCAGEEAFIWHLHEVTAAIGAKRTIEGAVAADFDTRSCSSNEALNAFDPLDRA